MKNLVIYELVVEVTRRCSLSCAHCFRGAAQPLDLDLKALEPLLDHVKSVSNLTLSGGEPLLRPAIIQGVLQLLEDKSVEVENISIITNGAISSTKLAALPSLLDKAWDTVTDPEAPASESSVSIYLSNDIYHYNSIRERGSEELVANTIRSLRKFRNSNRMFEPTKNSIYNELGGVKFVQPSSLIREGRAKKLRENRSFIRIVEPSYSSVPDVDITDDGSEALLEMLYVSSNGKLLFNCNASYSVIDEMGIAVTDLDGIVDNALANSTKVLDE